MALESIKQVSKYMGVGLASSILMVGNAQAGGSELDQLRAQLQALTERLAELETNHEDFEKEADLTHVKNGKKNLWVSLSGHVNRGVLWADNEHDSELFNVDNDSSSTRFRIEGFGRYDDKITVGTNIELQIESNSTGNVRFESASRTQGLSERKLEFYVRHEDYGTLWVGQGNTASFLTGSYDLSGTDIVNYSDPSGMAGGIAFYDDTLNRNGLRIGQVFSDFSGLGRDDRVRYDTPTWNGFVGSVSITDGGDLDYGVTWAREINDFKMAGAIGYFDQERAGADVQNISGSFSVLHASGVNLTVAAAHNDDDSRVGDESAHMWYTKLGYQFRYLDCGLTAVSVDYQETEGRANEDQEADAFGVALVQRFDNIATEAYISYRFHELDNTGTADYQDIHAVLAGARIKF